MLGKKYVNEIFQLFSGSESIEESPNKRFESPELLVELTPAEDFFKFNPHPLPPGFPESLIPSPVRISRIQSNRGVWIFFWNN